MTLFNVTSFYVGHTKKKKKKKKTDLNIINM